VGGLGAEVEAAAADEEDAGMQSSAIASLSPPFLLLLDEGRGTKQSKNRREQNGTERNEDKEGRRARSWVASLLQARGRGRNRAPQKDAGLGFPAPRELCFSESASDEEEDEEEDDDEEEEEEEQRTTKKTGNKNNAKINR
jgi:hypothetical protein